MSIPGEPNEPDDTHEGEVVIPPSPSVELPKENWIDIARRAVKGGAGAIPFAGGVATEFVDALWKSPYQKKMDLFFVDLATRLLRLEGQVADIDDRLQDPLVMSLGLAAAREAGATASATKRTYLANALLNVIEDRNLWNGREDFANILMRLVVELTPTHVRLLELFTDPQSWGERHSVNFKATLSESNGRWLLRDLSATAFPELDQTAIGAALGDLESRHLLGAMAISGADSSTPTFDELIAGIPSDLGRALLDFITRNDGEDT
jgi:hypothetical protein